MFLQYVFIHMRLISFDVGIKNLAYCIFEGASPDSLEIVGWKVANLIQTESPTTHQCSCVLPPKKKLDPPKPCGKIAKYRTPSVTPEYWCEVHAKKTDLWMLPKKEYTLPKLKSCKVDILQARYREILGDPSGLKKQELVDKLVDYYGKRCFQPLDESKSKTAGEVDLITIGRAIKRVLDEDTNTQTITHVIIENQISTIATRMKTIQGMIAQYFIMSPNQIHIEFVSSHNKLKGLGVSKETQTTSSYKTNKSDGIVYCRKILDETPHFERWKESFESSKKRDDLADCFLQGIWYIRTYSANIISYAEDLKINSV